jgi:hypothetical protein
MELEAISGAQIDYGCHAAKNGLLTLAYPG